MTTATTEERALTPEQKKFNSVRDMIYNNKRTLEAILPKVLRVDRFLRIAVSEVVKTPKLMECTPASLLGALIQSGQLGLEPNSILGHAYLIPFNNRKRNRMEVQLIPGYKGLIVLARRSGEISMIDAHEVLEGDHFEYSYGTDPKLTHKPAPSGRGKPLYFYAVARLKDGSVQFTVMSVEDMQKHRDRYSKAAQEGPWVSNFVEMSIKTCLRRLCKLLPASIELQQAIALDELSESGLSQKLGSLAGDIQDDEDSGDEAQTEQTVEQEEADMDRVREGLKATNGDAGASADHAAPPIDDVRWGEFIDHTENHPDRAAIKKKLKEKFNCKDLKQLPVASRKAFILSMQDQCKKESVKIDQFVSET